MAPGRAVGNERQNGPDFPRSRETPTRPELNFRRDPEIKRPVLKVLKPFEQEFPSLGGAGRGGTPPDGGLFGNNGGGGTGINPK